jgi:hypothetical protein
MLLRSKISLHGLAEGQKVSFEAKADPKRGKTSAENLKTYNIGRVSDGLGQRLANYKVPKQIVVVDDLPGIG